MKTKRRAAIESVAVAKRAADLGAVDAGSTPATLPSLPAGRDPPRAHTPACMRRHVKEFLLVLVRSLFLLASGSAFPFFPFFKVTFSRAEKPSRGDARK